MASTPALSSPLPAAKPPTSRLALTSLVLGILGLCICVIGPLLGIPAVICGLVGLARIDASRGTLGGRGLAIGGLVTGCLAIMMVFVVGVGAALLLPAVVNAREAARQAACASNLKQIGLGMMMYASDYGGELPPALEATLPYAGSERVFRCPTAPQAAAGTGFQSDYAYMGAGTRQAEIARPAQTVIVVEHEARHRHGMNMLFADGHVQFVAVAAGQDWRSVVTAQGWSIAGAPPPP